MLSIQISKLPPFFNEFLKAWPIENQSNNRLIERYLQHTLLGVSNVQKNLLTCKELEDCKLAIDVGRLSPSISRWNRHVPFKDVLGSVHQEQPTPPNQ